MSLLHDAASTAARLLRALPRRRAHSQGVASRCGFAAGILGLNVELATAAGWLHDIGYSPELAITGFHPLDGARFLRDVGLGDPRLWGLVAHHSCAVIEARRRGLLEVLQREFPSPTAGDVPLAVLTYSDMTTSPDGDGVPPESRVQEILLRYDHGNIVHDSIVEARVELLAECRRVEMLLQAATNAHH